MSQTNKVPMSVTVISSELPVKVHVEETDEGRVFSVVQTNTMLIPSLFRVRDRLEGVTKLKFVGHPGIYVDDPDERNLIREKLAEHDCFPVFIEEEDLQLHRLFVEQQIYQVFHCVARWNSQDPYSPDHLAAFRRVNRIWSETAIQAATTCYWVQDFSLVLVPHFLRRMQHSTAVGFFCHWPFPSTDLLLSIPCRAEMLHSLLCCDLIGFHFFDYARNFLSATKRLLGLEHEMLKGGLVAVNYQGRGVSIKIAHVAVEVEEIISLAASEDARTCSEQIRRWVADENPVSLPWSLTPVTPKCLVPVDDENKETEDPLSSRIESLNLIRDFPSIRSSGRTRYSETSILGKGNLFNELAYNNALHKNSSDHILNDQDMSDIVGAIGNPNPNESSSALRYVTQRSFRRSKGPFLFVSFDRLDLMSGIKLKLLAFQAYLRRYSYARSDCKLLQLTYPSKYGSYTTEEVNELVDLAHSINEEFSAYGHKVYLLLGPVRWEQKYGLFLAGDCFVDTSIREGLNVSSFEYISANYIQPKPLILSEFCGCNNVIASCLRIQPWQIEGVADQMDLSYNMEPSVRNWSRDLAYLRQNTLKLWAEDYISDLIHSGRYSSDVMNREIQHLGFGSNYRMMSNARGFMPLDTEMIVRAYRSGGDAETQTKKKESPTGTRLGRGMKQNLSTLAAVTKSPEHHSMRSVGNNGQISQMKHALGSLESLSVTRFADMMSANEAYGNSSIKRRAMRHSASVPLMGGSAQTGRRLIVLDFEGTLAPDPRMVKDGEMFGMSSRGMSSAGMCSGDALQGHACVPPSPEVLRILRHLCADPRNNVFIVSGRDAQSLERLFNIKNLGLCAEHGYYVKSKLTGNQWTRTSALSDLENQEWRQNVIDMILCYVRRTQGSFLENKGSALVFQYRDADLDFGEMQAKELSFHLEEMVAGKPLVVTRGKGYVEVRLKDVDKGKVVRWIYNKLKAPPTPPTPTQAQSSAIEAGSGAVNLENYISIGDVTSAIRANTSSGNTLSSVSMSNLLAGTGSVAALSTVQLPASQMHSRETDSFDDWSRSSDYNDDRALYGNDSDGEVYRPSKNDRHNVPSTMDFSLLADQFNPDNISPTSSHLSVTDSMGAIKNVRDMVEESDAIEDFSDDDRDHQRQPARREFGSDTMTVTDVTKTKNVSLITHQDLQVQVHVNVPMALDDTAPGVPIPTYTKREMATQLKAPSQYQSVGDLTALIAARSLNDRSVMTFDSVPEFAGTDKPHSVEEISSNTSNFHIDYDYAAIEAAPLTFVLCIGDDRSDEEMFKSLALCSDDAYTVVVGRKPSNAKWYVNTCDDVTDALASLLSFGY